MAFDDLEVAMTKRIVEEFIERRRPPEDIRDKVDLGYQLDGDD